MSDGVTFCVNSALNLSGQWKLLVNPITRLAAIVVCTAVSYYLVERPVFRLRARACY